MRFEEALAYELQTIPAFTDSVFPLVVSEGKNAPYLAYMSNEGVKLKTLSGYIDRKNISAEVNLVAKSYPDVKELTTLVMDKIISFQFRAIGDGTGPYIQDVSFNEDPKEGYEASTDSYMSTITFQVYL